MVRRERVRLLRISTVFARLTQAAQRQKNGRRGGSSIKRSTMVATVAATHASALTRRLRELVFIPPFLR